MIEQCPPESGEMDSTLPPATRAAARKTEGLKAPLKREQYQGIFVGIRQDVEQATRAKERVFSPRALDGVWDSRTSRLSSGDHYKTRFAEGTHVRIHPLLHWTELDIWRYSARGHSDRAAVFRP